MRDITLEETIYLRFTTRAFATGVPTTLAGTPALSVLESNNATPITSGVSISVDRASVAGLNEATIVATAANGYEAGKSYALYISTGTVGGVSVVGEVVAEFTVQASAALTYLGTNLGALGANATALGSATNLGLIKTKTDFLPSVAAGGAGGLPVSIAGGLDLDEMNADIELIQAVTDQLRFTIANQVDANALTGGGGGGSTGLTLAQFMALK